jgi:DNA adenine methylase
VTFGVATTTPPRLNLLRLEEDLSAVHLRLHQVFIEQLDWAECVRRYDRPHTLFYMDPPYWGTEGYDVAFGLEQYDKMATLMKTIQGRAVVSVNDIPEMRQAFAGLHMRELSIRYSVGGGTKPRRATGELLITNFNSQALPREPLN